MKGRRELDFLGGASRYKGQLATGRRPLVTLRAARPSLVEGARRLAEAGRILLRQQRNRQEFLPGANSEGATDEKKALSLD